MIQTFKRYFFEAARRLKDGPKKSQQLHGHSFSLTPVCALKQDNELSARDKLDAVFLPLIGQVNYRYLNETLSLENPEDAAITRWFRDQTSSPDLDGLKLQSIDGFETELINNKIYHYQHIILHSAHFLPNVPPGHKCGRLHGHNFHIILHWDAEAVPRINNSEDMWKKFTPIYSQLHQKLLNDIPGLENPTSENLCVWLWENFKSDFPPLCSVTVYETRTAGSTYNGSIWNCFKNFEMDSAIQGPYGPMGHSYRIQLSIQSEKLHETFGWTRDFGDIKELFKPYFKQLDHYYLNEVEDLQSPYSADMAHWIYKKLHFELPELREIKIWDTEDSGIIYIVD